MNSSYLKTGYDTEKLKTALKLQANSLHLTKLQGNNLLFPQIPWFV